MLAAVALEQLPRACALERKDAAMDLMGVLCVEVCRQSRAVLRASVHAYLLVCAGMRGKTGAVNLGASLT